MGLLSVRFLCVGCYARCIGIPLPPNLSELIPTKPLPVTAVYDPCLTFLGPDSPPQFRASSWGVSPCPHHPEVNCHTSKASSLCLALPFRPGDCHGLCRPWSCRVGHDRKTFTVTFQPLSPNLLIWRPKVITRPDPRLLRISPLLAHFLRGQAIFTI